MALLPGPIFSSRLHGLPDSVPALQYIKVRRKHGTGFGSSEMVSKALGFLETADPSSALVRVGLHSLHIKALPVADVEVQASIFNVNNSGNHKEVDIGSEGNNMADNMAQTAFRNDSDYLKEDNAVVNKVELMGLDRQVKSREGNASCSSSVGVESSSKSSLRHRSRHEHNMRWSMLLSTEALEDAHLSRAGSVTDAHVLRRKGRLKEQDGLIEFIISMHSTHSPLQAIEKVERWVTEHYEDPRRSTLSRLVPSVGRFYTPLPLMRALQEYDEFASITRRRFVHPNFAEIRHVLSIAQVHAIAEKLSLITFDADGTIYADGHHIERDNKMIEHIIKLMQHGIHVAIVTAAGYPGDASKFEHRFAGLLAAFKELDLGPSIPQHFHVMGGECNYLLKTNHDYRLEFVPEDLWQSSEMQEWSAKDIQSLLTDAECALRSAAARLRLPIWIVRKPRAVGAIPKEPTIYEVLEELALTVQVQLVDAKLPFCAFNGGSDVFVDIGNKSIGLGALMAYLGRDPSETLHVGDRFTVSGNDSATRSKCPILWVANPEETSFFARLLLNDIRLARLTPYIE